MEGFGLRLLPVHVSFFLSLTLACFIYGSQFSHQSDILFPFLFPFLAQMAGWFKQMPLAEVGLEYTLWSQRIFLPSPPTPSPPLGVSVKRWVQITDDMSLGSGTLALQEGTQPT